MANFRLKMAILLKGDRQEGTTLKITILLRGDRANFRLKIAILLRGELSPALSCPSRRVAGKHTHHSRQSLLQDKQ